MALAARADAFEFDGVMIHEETGLRVDPLLAEPEISVVDVDAHPADRADEMVVVRKIGPLVAASPLAPVDADDFPLALESPNDPVDGRVGRSGEMFSDEIMELLESERRRMDPQHVGDHAAGSGVAHRAIVAN